MHSPVVLSFRYVGLALRYASVHWIFIAFVAFGLIAEILDNGSQIYYYRKGI